MAQSRRRVWPTLALAASLGVTACSASTIGSGTAATETRAVSGFQSLALRGSFDIVVRQGSSESVQVRADDNILPLVETVVEGSGDTRTLHIQMKSGENVRSRTPIVVTVNLIRLDAVSSTGAGNVTIESLKTPTLAMRIAGSTDARLHQLDTDKFKISIAGSGDVQASGRAATLDVSIAGSGDVQTRELAADEVSISIAGSGDASVSARKTLSVSIAGSGDVDYGGGAELTKRRIAGSGSIRQRNP